MPRGRRAVRLLDAALCACVQFLSPFGSARRCPQPRPSVRALVRSVGRWIKAGRVIASAPRAVVAAAGVAIVRRAPRPRRSGVNLPAQGRRSQARSSLHSYSTGALRPRRSRSAGTRTRHYGPRRIDRNAATAGRSRRRATCGPHDGRHCIGSARKSLSLPLLLLRAVRVLSRRSN